MEPTAVSKEPFSKFAVRMWSYWLVMVCLKLLASFNGIDSSHPLLFVYIVVWALVIWSLVLFEKHVTRHQRTGCAFFAAATNPIFVMIYEVINRRFLKKEVAL